MRKNFKYRLYLTEAQSDALDHQLAEACRLYNAAVQERRDAYRIAGESRNYYDQANQLKEIRAEGDLELANFSCSQDVLRRVDKTFKAFFRRVEAGDKPGYPRFRPVSRYDSITFPSYGDGCKLLDDGKLRLQGVGAVKVKMHRQIEGEIKTVTIKREAGKWYAVLSVECAAKPLPVSTEATGVDVGLSAFATLADGTEIENPRYFKTAQAKLRRAQRKVARRKRGGNNRKKAVRELQRAHAHVRNQREGFAHKVSRTLVVLFGLIVIEQLNIKGLAAGMLAKSVNDAGWSSFIAKLTYKAAEAGRVLLKVDPRGTSQRCICGAPNPKTLSQRWHQCDDCGLSVARDHASALEILRLGLSLLGGTWPVAASVPNEAALL
ncbi:MAG: RNA-guided endonuclease InsQ/TnpB family protein [Blastocatellia bacterium]